jgi:hypothetical protein
MVFYKGFLETPHTPNSDSVCGRGEFFGKTQ